MPDTMRELKVVNANGQLVFHVDENGKVLVRDQDGKLYAALQAALLLLYDTTYDRGSRLSININAAGHVISLRNKTGRDTVSLDGANNSITLRKNDGIDTIILDGKQANLSLCKNNIHTVSLDGTKSSIRLQKNNGGDTVFIDGQQANMWLGGNNRDGDVLLFPSDAVFTDYNASASLASIHLDGETGDITLRNSDCAEDFEVMDGQEVEAGSVMVIDHEGKLRQSTEAYDKRVAGVVSGAGNYNPGIILGRMPSNGKMLPVALSGKVYCKADAGQTPIQVGDLLTTSEVHGYAMKAADPIKSFGAVIGKALCPLTNGQGLIPILVALQ